MTDRTADLLVRVAEFIRKATPEQIDALASGEVRLDFVPKGARIAVSTPKPATQLNISAEQVELDLKAMQDSSAATRYLTDLKLKKDQLLELAKSLNVTVPKSPTIAKVIGAIVEQKVSYRLDMEAIRHG